MKAKVSIIVHCVSEKMPSFLHLW